jgi:hydroxyacylglutathione hydrolase
MKNSNSVAPFLAGLAVGPINANCYIFGCPEDGLAVIIDPGGDVERIKSQLLKNNLKPVKIINTHAHIDHIGANNALKEHYGIPIIIHEDDAPHISSPFNKELALMYGSILQGDADQTVKDGDIIDICEHISLKVIHTPGHTKGGICLLSEDTLFTGDTLFAGSVGRSDLPGGSHEELINSIKEKLLPLGDDVKIFPGHGYSSTIGEEKNGNPFL